MKTTRRGFFQALFGGATAIAVAPQTVARSIFGRATFGRTFVGSTWGASALDGDGGFLVPQEFRAELFEAAWREGYEGSAPTSNRLVQFRRSPVAIISRGVPAVNEWKFKLKQLAKLESGERGTIIARAEYAHGENQYQLRYTAGDGRQCESWWSESALEAI